tara:strand:- start:1255 stop:1662 length:408 start_codon:yes stop_codon:yes gene_type:complete
MLATVDGSEDASARVQMPPVELTRVSKLENALTNLDASAVNLVEEQAHSLLTGPLEPIRGVPPGRVAIDGREAHKVALSHLGGSTLHDRKAKGRGHLIDDLGLADTVTATDEDRKTRLNDEGNNGVESSEIDGHG